MNKDSVVVVAWHSEEQIKKFLNAWKINNIPDWLILSQDKGWKSCAITKNKGLEEAKNRGARVTVVLDDDCFPISDVNCYLTDGICSRSVLERFVECHEQALQSQWVDRFRVVTEPRSRGTPHLEENRKMLMPVAASYGYWKDVGDYCAVGQLAYGARTPMKFDTRPIYGEMFAGSGMNMAFDVQQWWPVCQFINVSRFDDIWQSWIWQKIAYSRGYCFNMAGPLVSHSRQSNVWANLKDEVKYMEENEVLWRKIAEYPNNNYNELRKLLPI